MQRQDKGGLAAGLAKSRRPEDIDVVAEGDLGGTIRTGSVRRLAWVWIVLRNSQTIGNNV